MKFEELVKVIWSLVGMEETLEEKLDMLTAIGITTRSDLVFQACESVRNDLPDDIIGPRGETITYDDF